MIGFKIPNMEMDRSEASFYSHWDPDEKVYTLRLTFKANATMKGRAKTFKDHRRIQNRSEMAPGPGGMPPPPPSMGRAQMPPPPPMMMMMQPPPQMMRMAPPPPPPGFGPPVGQPPPPFAPPPPPQ